MTGGTGYTGGRLIERGSHGELLEHGGLYANLYEQQFRGQPDRGVPEAVSA